jgi:predicted O-methyltransferase YrrM
VGTLRKLGWWALSPFAYATTRVAVSSRCRVLAGPFAGLCYPPSFVPRLLFHGPYQVGSFELELHPAIERIVAARPDVIVNVGGAEGYYAVGLATRLPGAQVIAYELDPRLREAAAKLASLNGVAGRVELRGLCTVDALASLGSRLDGRAVCVLMDCEGAEATLADAGEVPWLAGASLLVELHPAADGEIAAKLERRFAATHELELIPSRVRKASEFDAQLRPIGGLRRIDRELLVAEFRDGSQDWLFATPREPGPAR